MLNKKLIPGCQHGMKLIIDHVGCHNKLNMNIYYFIEQD